MSLKFEEVIQQMAALPALSFVAPVRITAHGEEGTVLYGYGGLVYQPPDPPRRQFVQISIGDLVIAAQIDAYQFEGERLKTELTLTDARVRLLNNQVYDPTVFDDSGPTINYQSFLITQPESAAIEIGWATQQGKKPANRRLILRVTRGSWPELIMADIELDERAALLTGLGSLY